MKPNPSVGAVVASVALLVVHGARAEVRTAAPGALVVEHRFQLSSTPEAAWAVLVHPERYWPDDHTVLTVSLAARDGGTEAVVTYSLAGDESAGLGGMAGAVDGVVRQQFAGFAALASTPAP